MDRRQKETLVADMKDRLQNARAAFLVNCQGLDVETLNRLRRELRQKGSEFQVVKNRLMKIACRDTETESLRDHFVGPCALTIAHDDVVAPAKVLVDFSKAQKNLELKVGHISGRIMDANAIRRLAELPGREALLAQTLSVMKEVPTSLVRVLNGVVISFLNVLRAIGDANETVDTQST
ncbi:MAG: 50S ribosomal protein L10 [Deltaproteobacteria bacterium]|nr:50S ribosomal protein L10 [Deltaproteobacteria bacterium]